MECLFKGVVFIGTTTLLVSVLYTTIMGWKQLLVSPEKKYSKQHRSGAKKTLWVALIAILLTELMVRIIGNEEERSQLFWFHLVFSGIFFLLLLVLRFFLSGRKEPALHFVIAIFCTVAYLFSYGTGLVLLVMY